MPLLSVTLSRTGLGLEPLVVTNQPGTLRLAERDCTWPVFTMRRTYAPSSESVGGEQLEAKVPNQGTIGLGVSAHGDDTAEVEAAKAEWTAATTQFSYVLTLAVDGVTIGAYNADPEYPNWGALDSGDVAAGICKSTITIPINPPAGA
jgi:hypothetical protein